MAPDALARRCPRLGGEVTFAYCRQSGEEKAPCFKIFDCWWERFDVVAHLESCLAPEVFAGLAARRPPPNKVASLVDLIRQAKERAAES
ncbi:conserved hypothetical protein [Desulfosarcina cetonica]|uniref:hypothetical protein n=1 Tax=Desulfosarcina cetonica TaxID=90730 RepID=UPI0006CFE6B4|nr:hypothetical protein [Desulfosarcina cetonica]VTR69410.1 conserved hypothetical protein [Desulfosarcina cetonica]